MERCKEAAAEKEARNKKGKEAYESEDDVDPMSDNESPTKDPELYF